MTATAAKVGKQAVILGDDSSGAAFSPCRAYRYALWRRWAEEPPLVVIGLNPSTADHEQNDPTVRRCIGFAQRWGAGGLVMLNIFAFRATLPADMKAVNDPIGPETDDFIRHFAQHADLAIAAWGVHGAHRDRGDDIARMLPTLRCLGHTRAGHPRHPLYLRADTPHVPFGETTSP